MNAIPTTEDPNDPASNVEKQGSAAKTREEKVEKAPPSGGRTHKLLPRDIKFCVDMIEKHGEDYEVMYSKLCHFIASDLRHLCSVFIF